MEAANRIANTYSRSPIASRDQRIMDRNDYWRKKIGESKDHAAEGKKSFKVSAAHKKEIVTRDMGRAAMDETDFTTSLLLLTMLKITDEDLQAAGKLSNSELVAL